MGEPKNRLFERRYNVVIDNSAAICYIVLSIVRVMSDVGALTEPVRVLTSLQFGFWPKPQPALKIEHI
jgi:hypothetical protein